MQHITHAAKALPIVLLLLIGPAVASSVGSRARVKGTGGAANARRQWMAYCDHEDHRPGVWRSTLCYPNPNDAWHLARQHDLLYPGHAARVVGCR